MNERCIMNKSTPIVPSHCPLPADDCHDSSSQHGAIMHALLHETRLSRHDDAYAITQRGLAAFLQMVLAETNTCGTPGDGSGAAGSPIRVDRAAVDVAIAQIDARLSHYVNGILHHPQFQALESTWRGLKYVVDQVPFSENIKVDMVNIPKEDLRDDFDDTTDLTTSGLYRLAYANEYGVFGGQPYGMICSNDCFGPDQRDIKLLRQCAAVAAMTHAPFITNAAPTFFGIERFTELSRMHDLKSLFEGPQYAAWQSFRTTEESRYVGLCMPRFLLRHPYHERTMPIRSFNYSEDVIGQHDRYLWGAASMAFASRVAHAFAQYRWCPNIVGPQGGGAVHGLVLHHYDAMGSLETKIPTEILLTERREFELSEEGFIGLTYRKDTDQACFFSANSPQKPKAFANSMEGKAAETNHRLGTQLPYVFIVTRLAHYIKVLQREQIGSWKDRTDLQRELTQWLQQYVADMDNPAPGVRSRRPLRKAAIRVDDVEGQPGWYRCHLEVQPHMKYMGASFTLSLVGRLDTR